MKKQNGIISFLYSAAMLLVTSLLFLSFESLDARRRRKIIPRFQPVFLHAQNEEPKPAEANLEEASPEELEEPEEPEEVEEAEELEGIDDEEVEEPEEAEGPEEAAQRKEKPVAKEQAEKTEDVTPEKPGAPESTEPIGPEKPQKDIYLNFEDADLKTFANYIGELKNINMIPDPKIANTKISLTVRDPITAEGAWNIFLTLLEMSKFSIVKAGDVYKIIPQNIKDKEPLPVYINVKSENLPDSDLTIRYLTYLDNIPIGRVKSLLQSMLSQTGKIIEHADSNGFVITDKSYNIKKAMEIIHELDRSDIKQSVHVMKLKRANAGEVRQLFIALMRKEQPNPLARLLGRVPESSHEYFPPTTKIVADERTNSLILLGDQKSIERIEKFIIENVDTELKGVQSPIHIYELKYTDVESIKEILENVTKSESGSPAAKHGGIRGGVKYFKEMKFSMDKQNNRLLVSSTDNQDWKLLKETIKDLDKPQPQVAIETLIITVQFDKKRELGSQIRNKKHGTIGRNIDFQAANLEKTVLEEGNTSLLGNLISLVTGGLGSTILTFGNIANKNVWATVKMLQSQENVSTLSEPFILTTNMKKATVSVGSVRRVSYQKAVADDATTGDTRGFKDAKASLTLNVTPQINLEGVINLDINVDIVDFATSDVQDPNTFTKKLETKVSVANGQVLALGGFVKTKITEATFKTPLLGDIPLLGWLFKNKKRQVTKEYVFIFMAPTIVKPRQAPGVNLYTKLKLHQAREDIEDAIEVRKINDPIHNWFFNADGETYSHKITDYANARYQPTAVDIMHDPYYRTEPLIKEEQREAKEKKKKPPEDEPPPEEQIEEEHEEKAVQEEEPTEEEEEREEELEQPEPEQAEPEQAEPKELEIEVIGPEESVPELEGTRFEEIPVITIPEEEITQKPKPKKTTPNLKQLRRQKLRQLLSAHAKPSRKKVSRKQTRRKQMKRLLQKQFSAKSEPV